MKILLSTSQSNPKNNFDYWKNSIEKKLRSSDFVKIGSRPFEGLLEGANIASNPITRITQTAVRIETTEKTIRRDGPCDTLFVGIILSGNLSISYEDRQSVQYAGDLMVLDRKPTVMETKTHSQSLIFEIPRSRLEIMLGSASLYAGLKISSDLATTSIAVNFLKNLLNHHERLSPDSAKRVFEIGIDLIIGSIAEKLTQSTPKSLAGTILIQRAKAYVETNISDPTLSPSKLSSAVGVSLRRLQQLFKEHDHTIVDWIWSRRLKAASIKLSDPDFIHLPISAVAYSCGFIDQAHFSRRFKEFSGLTPSEYQRNIINAKIESARSRS